MMDWRLRAIHVATISWKTNSGNLSIPLYSHRSFLRMGSIKAQDPLILLVSGSMESKEA